ncbi:glucosamine 6-phosphate N-acetyltransferase isoform X2 [Chiloscyllium plagiosum]|uniref:glucosamine 6-phosphate N-acetyltransferase isoform X2 n=1 Tax=Chiloscyllium plagiosum TaxID=36176 RepID=UPI001CB88708|nr:glucosamine 6-phosphate N-acetyltransferase isoform X2 [Chiloscyllium plagiosum]
MLTFKMLLLKQITTQKTPNDWIIDYSFSMYQLCSSPAMILDDTPLFDPIMLRDLDWSQNMVKFSPEISPLNPGVGLVMRPLCTADFNREKFEHMKQTGDYYTVVIEDTHLGQVIATATLIIEHKFIHSCAKRGRIEEVVVSDECRGRQLGKLLVSALTLLSKKLNCYKITLECLPKNEAFYQKFGYKATEEVYMQCRFFD